KQDEHSIGSSSIYRLCEEIIALREINNRQHKMFEQTLAKTRDAVQTSFNSFAADTQRAYQQLRQEFHGEKRISLALLNELVEIAFDMQRIIAARPSSPSPLGGVGEEGRAAMMRCMSKAISTSSLDRKSTRLNSSHVAI